MIDAKMSFASAEISAPAPDRRMAPLAGLGLAALVSLGMWGLLALMISRLF